MIQREAPVRVAIRPSIVWAHLAMTHGRPVVMLPAHRHQRHAVDRADLDQRLALQLGLVVFLVGSFGLMFAIEKTKNSAAGVPVLLAFTFFMGLMLSRLIGAVLGLANGANLIMLAFAGTGWVMTSASLITALAPGRVDTPLDFVRQVVLSEPTWDRLTAAPEQFERLPETLVKGRDTPVEPYRITVT